MNSFLARLHSWFSYHLLKQVKTAYICGPLTELPEDYKAKAKQLYQELAETCLSKLGQRAFVPHEHYDPEKHAHFTPAEVDSAERYQVCCKTSVLIVVALAPSWGGGIEVEMANRSHVPVIILHKKGTRLSRLLRGNPAVRDILDFDSNHDASNELSLALHYLTHKDHSQQKIKLQESTV